MENFHYLAFVYIKFTHYNNKAAKGGKKLQLFLIINGE